VGFFLDLLFGSIGTGYLIYGKKNFHTAFLVCGFVLVIYPYFVSNAIVCALIGVVFVATPFVLQKME
jgi:hypothetical protein